MLKYSTRKNLDRFLPVFLLGSLAFAFGGARNMDNYPYWSGFILLLGFAGLVLGYLGYRFALKFYPSLEEYRNSKKISLVSFVVVIAPLIFIGMGSLINNTFTLSTECKKFLVLDTGASGSRRQAYYVFIRVGDQQERLEFHKSFVENIHTGDSIELCVKTGLLGFSHYERPSGN